MENYSLIAAGGGVNYGLVSQFCLMLNGIGGISTSGMSAFLLALFRMLLLGATAGSEFSLTGSVFSCLDGPWSSFRAPTWNIGWSIGGNSWNC